MYITWLYIVCDLFVRVLMCTEKAQGNYKFLYIKYQVFKINNMCLCLCFIRDILWSQFCKDTTRHQSLIVAISNRNYYMKGVRKAWRVFSFFKGHRAMARHQWYAIISFWMFVLIENLLDIPVLFVIRWRTFKKLKFPGQDDSSILVGHQL